MKRWSVPTALILASAWTAAILGATTALGFAAFGQAVVALPQSRAASPTAAYRPGDLFVKYKAPARPPAADLFARRASFASYTGSSRLDALHQRYRVQDIQPLFRAPLLSGSTAARGSTASRADWDAHIESLRQRFAVRARRAPAQQVTPDLWTIYKLTVPADTDIQQLADEYAADPSVEYAEPNYLYQLYSTPNDPFFNSSGSWGQGFPDLWGLYNIEAPAAWDLTTGAGVTIAVLDTGLIPLPDIAANIWVNPGEVPGNGIDDDGNGYVDDVTGWGFADPHGSTFDAIGHGTHVAGTLAAVGNNADGIIGVAWQAKVMPLGIFTADGQTSSDAIAAALLYAVHNGADVVNMSFGGFGASFVVRDAIDYAAANGLVLVAAAGNDALDVKGVKPANLDPVIATAAVDHTDQPAFFSNFGGKVELAAPGGGDQGRGVYQPFDSVLSLTPYNCCAGLADPKLVLTAPGDLSQFFSRQAGTSSAAPHVSGVAALILSRHPEFTAEQVRQALRDSADDLGPAGRDARYGYGRLNAARAVALDAVPVARLETPANLTRFHGELTSVRATVRNPGGPTPSWHLSFGPQGQTLSEIASGSGAVDNALLTSLDTAPLAPGNYLVRLEVSAANASAADTLLLTRGPSHPYVQQLSDGAPILVVFPLALRPNAWSADGGTLVWTEQPGPGFQRVVARDLRTGTDRTIVQFRLGTELLEGHDATEAVISPDGSTVACAAPEDLSTSVSGDVGRNFQLFVFDTLTGALTQISHAQGGTTLDFHGLSIAADGRRLALISRLSLDPTVNNSDGNPELFFWDKATATFHQVTRTTRAVGGALGSPVLSADGKTIAFVSYDDLDPLVGNASAALQIFTYDVQSGRIRQLTQMSGALPYLDSEIAMRADGSLIAASIDNPKGQANLDQRTIVVIDTTSGAQSQLLTVPLANASPNFLRFAWDGQKLFFPVDVSRDRFLPVPASITGFGREIVEYDMQSQQLRGLTALDGGFLGGLAVAPDARLAFFENQSPRFDPDGTNDDRSAEIFLCAPTEDGGFLSLKRGTITRARKGPDRFTFRGLLVRPSATPLDPAETDVSVAVLGANGQLLGATLTADSVAAGARSWRWSAQTTSGLTKLVIAAVDDTHYNFRITGRSAGLFADATPYLAVQVRIGTAAFANAQRFRSKAQRLAYP
jgi:subtilisin family serine protease/Tol biopolymer transport system component